MTFNVPLLFAGLIFSSVGFVYFSYGRKQTKFKVMITGLVLMIYPYFVSKLAIAIIIGLILTALPIQQRWFEI